MLLAHNQRIRAQRLVQRHRHDSLHREVRDGDGTLVVLGDALYAFEITLHPPRDIACCGDGGKRGEVA